MKNQFTDYELSYLLDVAKANRESSATLAALPEQRHKRLHNIEVEAMDDLITKLERLKNMPESKKTKGESKKRYEIVFSSGEVYRSTSDKNTFMQYVEEITKEVNNGNFDPNNIYLRDTRETPLLQFLQKQD